MLLIIMLVDLYVVVSTILKLKSMHDSTCRVHICIADVLHVCLDHKLRDCSTECIEAHRVQLNRVAHVNGYLHAYETSLHAQM